jgi:hypothetical protein
MYAEVRTSPGFEARSVRICNANVNRVLTFIRYYDRHIWIIESRNSAAARSPDQEGQEAREGPEVRSWGR